MTITYLMLYHIQHNVLTEIFEYISDDIDFELTIQAPENMNMKMDRETFIRKRLVTQSN